MGRRPFDPAVLHAYVAPERPVKPYALDHRINRRYWENDERASHASQRGANREGDDDGEIGEPPYC